MPRVFKDRHEAGEILAGKIDNSDSLGDVIVLGLPRGGVPVAFEIAKRLHAPLDVFIVRKLGVPGHEELAAGAIASGGVRVFNDEVMRALPNALEIIDEVLDREEAELVRREKLYRDARPPLDVENKTIILVDDGLATGATMRAAVKALRKRGAAKITVAVPVGSRETCRELETLADEVICLTTPEDFHAVGQFYENFSQTTDDEVRELLARSTTTIR